MKIRKYNFASKQIYPPLAPNIPQFYDDARYENVHKYFRVHFYAYVPVHFQLNVHVHGHENVHICAHGRDLVHLSVHVCDFGFVRDYAHVYADALLPVN